MKPKVSFNGNHGLRESHHHSKFCIFNDLCNLMAGLSCPESYLPLPEPAAEWLLGKTLTSAASWGTLLTPPAEDISVVHRLYIRFPVCLVWLQFPGQVLCLQAKTALHMLPNLSLEMTSSHWTATALVWCSEHFLTQKDIVIARALYNTLHKRREGKQI